MFGKIIYTLGTEYRTATNKTIYIIFYNIIIN